ncbi:unnamed protein product [Eruca vesicaria subsp. sativa]|uniref:Uncharacterized protein n=1 Tax=Eruca vesicaria subsp. sativa TaxID=29727 RepID=A0ABC8KHR8_ERUVS|nr:unnamed protein product [Eruca vesicaria subsp. sativa]
MANLSPQTTKISHIIKFFKYIGGVVSVRLIVNRQAKLQAQFSQMRPAFIPGMGPRIPMFPGGAPGPGQQFFYGQGPPQMMPHQAGFGYQPQMVPGMRPGYFGPMMQPGQQGPRSGGRRSGDGSMRHQPQHPMPFMQPQMMQGGG